MGAYEDWLGVDYKKMRTKMLDDEKVRIDVALRPICDRMHHYFRRLLCF